MGETMMKRKGDILTGPRCILKNGESLQRVHEGGAAEVKLWINLQVIHLP